MSNPKPQPKTKPTPIAMLTVQKPGAMTKAQRRGVCRWLKKELLWLETTKEELTTGRLVFRLFP